MTALMLSVQNVIQTHLRVVALPESPPATTKAYHLVRNFSEGQLAQQLTEKEKDHWVKLAQDTAISGSWANLKPRDLKNIGSCLWYGDEPLADDKNFLSKFLEVCKSRIKKSICNVLIGAYLRNYEKDKPGIAMLGEWLAKTVFDWNWRWSDRQKQFSLFNGHEAPRSIANIVMTGKENIGAILESYGISGGLQSGGMASAAFAETLIKYKENVTLYDTGETLSRLKRILEWAILDGEQFSYQKSKALFIESLLLPWANTSPDEKIINMTQGFLVDCFGDPRLGGANWKGVNENAMRVIRGWLVKRALAQFLDVVDELALDHQWKYRRAFWMAYYKKGVISDAWVAFASNGAAKANQIAKRSDDASWLSFGRLQGSGDPNHAVLILKIGDLTIADFSHNGQCRMWNKENNKSPKPYEKYYDRVDLTHGKANSEDVHSNSPGYLWQGRVASKISSWTGVRVSQGEYVPK